MESYHLWTEFLIFPFKLCLYVCLMCEHMRTSENNYKELILACCLYMISGDQTQVSNFVQQAPFLTELPLWPRTSVLKIKKNLWMDNGGGCLLSVDLTTLGLG